MVEVAQHRIKRSPVIAGPTAGGKSALAVAVAREFERRGLGAGEVVTADAFQVYRGMDIGTAKPTEAERAGVPHHLIDVVEPSEGFTVHQWLGLAESAIEAIRARGNVPIVAGGSHLFIKSLLEGLFEGPGGDAELRAELEAVELGELRAELERVDPQAAERIHPNDRRRTVRALEVFRLTGRPISEHQSQWDAGRARPDLVLVGLRWSSEALNRRINARVREMVAAGLVAEVRGLWGNGLLRSEVGSQAREGLGYKQLAAAFDSGRPVEDAIERIKIETRRFAKSQRTWLRRLGPTAGSIWLEPERQSLGEMTQIVANACLTLPEGGEAREN